MSRIRAISSPELVGSTRSMGQPVQDVGLEGITTNVKLLLKLIHDHNEASARVHDDWRSQRVATMMTILDDVKSRIQKSQQSSSKKKELRRCNTDLKPNHSQQPPRKPAPNEPPTVDDVQRVRKELSASMAARKSLQLMCSSLGKEREIMAVELSTKAHQLIEMEELINDLRAQNERLLEKAQAWADEHKEKNNGRAEEGQSSSFVLQERNKELSEQLLKSIDGYRSLKRKHKKQQEENAVTREALGGVAEEMKVGIDRILGFRKRVTKSDEETPIDLEEEILELEKFFEGIDMKISKLV